MTHNQRYYMGWPMLPRGLLVVGEVAPQTRGHCLNPTPHGTVGHNLWRLMVAGNTVDHYDTFSRTDYLYSCELFGLCLGETWDRDEAFKRASIVTDWQGPVLLLGNRVRSVVRPAWGAGGMPLACGRVFVIHYPQTDAEAYRNREVYRENSRIAAKALCAGFEWAAKSQGYPHRLTTNEEMEA